MSKIISVSGLIGSGKDSIANYLITHHGFKKMAFADSLKDAVSSVFGWDRQMLEGSTGSSRQWREQVDVWWSDRLGIPNLTPRWVLQHFGTELLREHFHQDIWIASIENKLRNNVDDVVITDARFFNELDAIKHNGGTAIRVKRGQDPEWVKAAERFNTSDNELYRLPAKVILAKCSVHASEYSSVGFNYDHIVENSGTIDDLHASIERLI
jgi:hypothetical protein